MVVVIADDSMKEVKRGCGVKCCVAGSKFVIEAAVKRIDESTVTVSVGGMDYTILHGGILEVIDPSDFVLSQARMRSDSKL